MTCAIVPPLILTRLAERGDTALSAQARQTLELDVAQRGERTRAAPSSRNRLRRTVFDADGTRSLPGTVARREGEPPTGDPAVDEAYEWLGASYTFFQRAYGRNSVDDAGLPLEATVHYGQNYDNAFWTRQRMVYGDGDGRVFRRFTRPIGVTGHELTHGVVQFTAGLGHTDQTGALNESMSDVFGSLVKQHHAGETAAEADWLVGEGIFQPGIHASALRSLAAPGTAYDDPLIGEDPQPRAMAGYVETDEDSGGVHINSGIPNHAFYLAATSIGGHAWEGAGRIWYDVLTGGELPSDVRFGDFARATVDAAARLCGRESKESKAVRDAWSRVGMTM